MNLLQIFENNSENMHIFVFIVCFERVLIEMKKIKIINETIKSKEKKKF